MTERSLQIIDAQIRPTAVAMPGPRLGLPTPSELEALKAYGQLALASGMAPKHIDKWETAVVIMRYAHQLGVDEFTGLQNMWVIGGKPAMMASLQHGIILRDHGDDAIHVRVSNAERCELVCKRRNASQSSLVTYTYAEAVTAGLPTTNATWKKYPADMLFARCISRAGRQLFRDSTMGLYIPEEIGGNVAEVHGEIIEMEPSQPSNIHAIGGGTYAEVLSDRPATKGATKEQLDEIAALGKELGLDAAGIRKRIGKAGKDLTYQDALNIRNSLALDVSELNESVQDVEPDGPMEEPSDTLPGMSSATNPDRWTA